MKKERIVEIGILIFVIIAHLYVTLSPDNNLMGWYTTDDAFYYFKTAQNISEGYGITFDRIGNTNGFHPLWMVICIPLFALARLNLILPLRLMVMILALLNAATAILLFRLLRNKISFYVAALAAAGWVVSMRIHWVTAEMGMESGINAFCQALFLYQYSKVIEKPVNIPISKNTYLRLGLLGMLVVFSRLDNSFFIILAGVWLVFREKEMRSRFFWDLIIFLLIGFGSYILRFGLKEYYTFADIAVNTAVLGVLTKMAILYFFEWINLPVLHRRYSWLIKIVLASGVPTALILAANSISTNLTTLIGAPRLILAFDVLATFLYLLVRQLIYLNNFKKQADDPRFPFIPLTKKEWSRRLRIGIPFFGVLAVLMGAYMIFNQIYAGTPLPVSGQVKRWWGTITTVYGSPSTNWLEMVGITPDQDNSPWMLVTAPLYAMMDITGISKNFSEESPLPNFIVAGILFLFLCFAFFIFKKTKHKFREQVDQFGLEPLFLGCFLQIISMRMSGYVSTHIWYWVIEILFVSLLLAILLEDTLVLFVTKRRLSVVLKTGMALAVAAMAVNFIIVLVDYIPYKVTPGEEDAHLWGVQALEAHTEPGSLIGSTGGGAIAYFIRDRTIINLDGLISSNEYFQHLKQGTAADYLESKGMRYLYTSRSVLQFSEPYIEIFQGRLKYLNDYVGASLYRFGRY